MKKFLRIITLLMAIVMAMSVAASAAGTGGTQSTDPKYFKYAEKDGKVTIIKYTGTDTVVVIPEKINGKPVTWFSSEAFKENATLKEITIPASVPHVSEKSFKHCVSLEKVTMLGSTSVGEEAFSECYKLKTITVNGFVWESAFENCTSLETAYIDHSYIYGNAFKGCTKLKSVELGEHVGKCDATAFDGCTALAEIVLSEDNVSFKVKNGRLYERGEDTPLFANVKAVVKRTSERIDSSQATDPKYFEYTEKDGEITIKKYTGTDTVMVIPEEINGKPVVGINYDAFKGNTTIVEVVISGLVEMISFNAFEGCTALKKVTLLGRTSICDEAFKGCVNLRSIAVKGSVNKGAFEGCIQLRSVEIGADVYKIEEGAFDGCTALTEIKVSEDNRYFKVVDGVLYRVETKYSDDYMTKWEEKTPVFTLVKAESLPATKRAESSLPLVQVTYDKDGKVSTKTEYTYDASGNLLKKSYYSYEVNPSSLYLNRESTYTYDEKGNLLRENIGKRIDFEYQFVDNYGYKEYKYNSYGLLVQEIEHDGYTSYDYTEKKTTYTYNNYGQMVKSVCHRTVAKSSLMEDTVDHSWTVQTFDSKGNFLAEMVYSGAKAEKFSYGIKYEYDAAGNQIAEWNYDSDGSVTSSTKWSYNSAGKLVERRTTSGSGEVDILKYEYDSKGNLTAVRNGEKGALATAYTYDSKDRELTKETYDVYGDGKLAEKRKYERDTAGNIVACYFYSGKTSEVVGGYTATYDAKGNQLTLQYLEGSRIECTYDANGNMTSQIMYKPDDNSKISSATYWTYDEYGNELSYKYINAEGNVVAHRENTYIYFE